jgi:2-oxoglutarate ferredoxin oxidoreductase subunit alpha
MTRKAFWQGNEAVLEGAVAAGARFYAGYPITPSSEIAELASRRLPALGGVFIQMEDEIASMAALVGASLAGAKAFTATSGPGFSLMQENIGLAIMVEAPCVVINVMRSGPSTGLATKPAQADVMQARWGTHGDHPAVALVPASVSECFSLTVAAFNLAERLRMPVFVLSDEIIGHMRERVEVPPEGSLEIWERPRPSGDPSEYRPYRPGPDGVPPLAEFGGPYVFHATSSMHDERGVSANDAGTAAALIARLGAKVLRNWELLPPPEIVDTASLLGSGHDRPGKGAKPAGGVLLVAFGSSARSARQVLVDHPERFVTLFRPRTLWPFPEAELSALVEDHESVVVAEMNTGQLVLEAERVVAGRRPVRAALRSDGEIITPEEIWEVVCGRRDARAGRTGESWSGTGGSGR